MDHRKKNILFSSAAFVITMVVLFTAAEAMIRLRPPLYCEGYRPSQDDKVVFELYPGYEIRSIDAKISKQGLNDNYYSVKKSPGVYRIAVVGDSTSFGWKVGQDQSFPKVLESLLNSTGRAYEVINFSVPGYNTSQELALIKYRVIKFEPDMIILVYCGNDRYMSNYFKPKKTPLNFLYNSSCFARYALCQIDHRWPTFPIGMQQAWILFKKDFLGMYYYTHRLYPYPGLEEVEFEFNDPPKDPQRVPLQYRYMIGYSNYREHLQEIRDFLKSRSIVFINAGGMDNEIRHINRSLGIEYVFDFGEIPECGNASQYLSKVDRHFSVQGHQMIAQKLFEYINKKILK
jgi:hypothetical protein